MKGTGLFIPKTMTHFEVVYDTPTAQQISHPFSDPRSAEAFAEEVTAIGGQASHALVRRVSVTTVGVFARPA